MNLPTVQQELESFVEFAKQRIHEGTLTLDELFDLWRSRHPGEMAFMENVAAIEHALREHESGDRGTPAGEHSAKIRKDFGIGDE
ncbi:MAG: hypothetical protein U1D30_01850 [Planctomycetota bacterium]